MTPSIKDYIELCKPRVVLLMLITAIVAMLLATPVGIFPWSSIFFGTLGIAFTASAGGTINHLIDRKIDSVMARTKARPIASGRIQPSKAILMATALTVSSMLIFILFVNVTAAILSLLTLIGYAGIYTVFLKRATPQNIVIGGLAGAMPPLLGWSAISGQVDAGALLLVLIIFTWTPPHFWALSISRHEEYAKANIPMLPVTHGLAFTRLNVLLYTILMIAVTYLPFAIDMCGAIYLIGVSGLNIGFLVHALRLYRHKDSKYALQTFHYSIIYLGLLFALMLLDHFIPIM